MIANAVILPARLAIYRNKAGYRNQQPGHLPVRAARLVNSSHSDSRLSIWIGWIYRLVNLGVASLRLLALK